MNNLVTDKQAYNLKTIGFNLPTHTYIYTGDTGINEDFRDYVKLTEAEDWNSASLTISVPTYDQVYNWFKEKYNIESCIEPTFSTEWIRYNSWFLIIVNKRTVDRIDCGIYLNKIDCINRLIDDIIDFIDEINYIRKETGLSYDICTDRYLYFDYNKENASESIKKGYRLDKTGQGNHKFLY